MSSSCTILIVENFLPDQELYRRCLLADSSCTYSLLSATCVSDGLELCRTRSIDAILVDYQLPDADGLEFLRALQAQSDGNQPPVVIVTGQGDETVAVQAMKLGAEDYLVKQQLNPERLQLAVRSAIENARLRLRLRQSEDRFRVSIENLLDCFGICTAIRNQTGEILDLRIDYLNAAALQNNSMTAADIGRGLCEVFPAHRDTGLFEEYCQVIETGKPLAKEELIYSDVFGTQRLTRAYDIQVNQLNDGIVLAWRDVTARKQAELERQQQLQRERILNQMTQQIRRSLDPSIVLNTAVDETRQLLGVDRAYIYRFNPDFSGVIGVESVGEGWESALAAKVEDTYFMETQGEAYRQGRIQVVEDIETADLTDCHAEMLRRFGIRANLVVPILQGEQLWGLLVLNQCSRPRQWQDSEIQLLQQLAAQTGIAIQQAELHQQVRESRQQLELALEGTEQGMWDYDLLSDRAYWSPQCKRLFGLEPDDSPVTNAQFLACLHPDDRDRVACIVQEVLQTNQDYDIEYRVIWADGSLHWIHAKAKVLRDGQSQPLRMVGTVVDISERKQTEQRLRQSEEQLQIGMQVAGVAIAHFDYASNQVTLTPEAAMMFGIPLDQLRVTREQIHATFHPEEHDELMEMIRQVLDPAGKGWFAREYRVVWQSGEVRWLNVQKQVFFDRSGTVPRPDYAILAAIDITERKQAEATVQEQLAQIEAIYATAPIGLCFINRERRFVQMNERLAEINGLPASAQLGRTVREVLPELAEVQEPIFEQVLQTGTPVLDVEIQGTTPAQPGVKRYWLVSYYPLIAADEQILGINIMVQEITERKRAETERNRLLIEAETARAEAEAANRSKDEFVALVAHELRSPLNAILGWAKLLQMRQLDAATTMRALETIARNTQAQVQLVEDLLDVSRMMRGTLQLTMEPVDLVQVIEEAIETVRPAAAAKSLDLETRLYPVVPTLGDFNRLRQVVLNLLTNAIKFTPAGGRVAIALESSLTEVCIRVSDTGKGIKPDFLPRIFERFSQDQQNPASKQGLGLGLAIVKHLVESHGGTITVESLGEGQGATFTVLLPPMQQSEIDREEFALLPAVDPDAKPLANLHILLVDDEPDMLDLTTFMLEQYGAIVQTANSAAAALEQLQRFQPDVLLSDIAMPQQDGYELLRQVQELRCCQGQSRYPEGKLPAIALTAYASQSRYEESLRAGFQQHLTKPVEPEALVQAILSAVSWRKP